MLPFTTLRVADRNWDLAPRARARKQEDSASTRAAALQSRRDLAATLFESGCTQGDVARQLRVSRVSALRWYRTWRDEGRAGLLGILRLGRTPRLDLDAKKRLHQILLAGPQGPRVRKPHARKTSTHTWTLALVSDLLRQQMGIEYHPTTVSRVLRSIGLSIPKLRVHLRSSTAKTAKAADGEAPESRP